MKNLNDLAKKLTLLEGGKISISIAQVKEVLKWLSVLIATDIDTLKLLVKYSERIHTTKRKKK